MSTPFNYKRVGESTFEFATEMGVLYRASFANAVGYFPRSPTFSSKVRAFDFVVLENPHTQLPHDPRVGATISFLILQFFEQDPEGVIFFIHEGADGKERGRKKLFDTWFRKVAASNLVKKDAEIPVGRFTILVSILLRASHPQFEVVSAAFDQLVLEATTKPEDEA